MTYSFPYGQVNDPKQEEHQQDPVRDEDQLHNISEGSEFLDDALRMKDQPLEDSRGALSENFE